VVSVRLCAQGAAYWFAVVELRLAAGSKVKALAGLEGHLSSISIMLPRNTMHATRPFLHVMSRQLSR
jgi:hypothetical protein